MDAHLEQEERETFDRFRAEQGTDGRAAEGLEPVLAALVEQKVETLLLREGANAPGSKCVTCGWLGPAGPAHCPVDETALDTVDNILEPAIQAAIQQSATVHVVRERDDGQAEPPFVEPIAALLRY